MPTLDELIAEALLRDLERRRIDSQRQSEEERQLIATQIASAERELKRKFGEDFEAALQPRYEPYPNVVHACFRYRNKPMILYAEDRDDGKTYWTISIDLPAGESRSVIEDKTDTKLTRDHVLLAIDELTKWL